MIRRVFAVSLAAMLVAAALHAAPPRRPGQGPGPAGPGGPGPLGGHAAAQAEWTGYVTDTHCGAKGATQDHTAACVEKCIKGGSKAQILNEADGKIYNLDSFDKLKDLVGVKVTIKGSYVEGTNTIVVQSASKAAAQAAQP